MKKFQANTAFYSENYDSFTSSDEFDLATRVHVTNELPPQDMYDMSHSMIKNDLWKWFFGSSFISYGVSYNEETNGVEKIDREGYLIEPSIAKYVNGVRAQDFGPKPRYVWNENYKKDYQEYLDYIGDEYIEDALSEDDFKYKVEFPEYRRIEIDGTFLPEVDLLLHEAYRYLGHLYPDHPDFTKILTINEFNDDIAHAAALIDYVPNFEFYDWLSTKLDYSKLNNKHLSDYIYDESAKLKIRNLLNYSFRKKFFGSKSGYRQFAAGAMQHASIMSSAQYVPYKSFYVEDDSSNKDSLNEKWHKGFEKTPTKFQNRSINKSHVLYNKFFRIIDFTNLSYDLLNRYKEPPKFYGTAYPTPYSNNTLYEYPLQRVLDRKDYDENKDGLINYLTMADDFSAGQKIKINGQTSKWRKYDNAHINSINKINSYKVTCELAYKGSKLDKDNSKFETFETVGNVTKIDIDTDIQPLYTKLKIYPSNKEILNYVISHDNDKKVIENGKRIRNSKDDNIFTNVVLQSNDYINSTKEIRHAVYENQNIVNELTDYLGEDFRLPKDSKFTLDPLQDGCLHMVPQQFITTFADDVNVSIDDSEWSDYDNKNPESHILYGTTSMSDKGYVRKNDILSYSSNKKLFESAVVGINNAFVQFKLEGNKTLTYDEITYAVNEVNNTETARHGIVIKFDNSNIEAGGKQVVLFGQPQFADVSEDNGKFISKSVFFNVKAIPTTKNHIQLLALYDNFKTLAETKFKSLYHLIGKGDESTEYGKLCKSVLNIESNYENLQVAFAELKDAYNKKELVFDNNIWKKVKRLADKTIDSFISRPALERRLRDYYNEWIVKNNVVASDLPNEAGFNKNIDEFNSKITEYYTEFRSWIVGEIAILKDRKFYEKINTKNLDHDYQQAIVDLEKVDKVIFEEMLPNRAFLLNPLPKDLLMETIDDSVDASYSLKTSLDQFVTILKFGKNEYDDQLRLYFDTRFGSNGILTNCMTYNCDAWNFGSLNTVSIVETHYDESMSDYVQRVVTDNFGKFDFIDEYYKSSKDLVREYSIKDNYASKEIQDLSDTSTIKYFSINTDIIEMVDSVDDTHKFSYADPNFLEVFLTDENKNNIQGEVLNYNKVKINCHFEEGSYEITFEEKQAMNDMHYLSTGDQVTGFSIADDTYIESIDIQNNKIIVTNPMYITGEAELIFLCKIQFNPEDNSKDFYKYRVAASKNGTAIQGSVFESDYTKDISQYVFNTYIDSENFRQDLIENLQTNTNYKNKFNSMVSFLHKKNQSGYVALPSAIKFSSKLFLDINAYSTYTENDKEYIMSQKVLDYFEGYSEDIARVSDDLSIGVSINAYTTSDMVTTTDKTIKSRFVTTSAWKKYIPYYIKIGTGFLGEEIFNQRSGTSSVDKSNNTSSKNVQSDYYGDALYGQALVASVSEDSNGTGAQDNSIGYTDIAEPLFRVQLGEYEVSNKIKFSDLITKNFTTVQFLVIRRSIEDLVYSSSGTVLNKNIISNEILSDWPKELYTVSLNDGTNLNVISNSGGNFKKVFYCGAFYPELNSKREIIYPKKPLSEQNLNYYSIVRTEEIDTASSGKQSFKDGEIIIWNGSNWEKKRFLTCGFYGTENELKKYVKANDGYSTEINNFIELENDKVDLMYALLYKIIMRLGFVVDAANLQSLSYERLNNLYFSYMNGTLNPEDYPEIVIDTGKEKLVDNNVAYWFEYIGSSKYSSELNSLNLTPGVFIGFIPLNGKFIVTKLKFSKQFVSSDMKKTLLSKLNGKPSSEYLCLIGKACSSSKSTKVLVPELLDGLTTKINLSGFTDIVKGSVDSTIRFKFNTTGKGYEVNSDGSYDTSDEKDISLVEDSIYVDTDEKLLYTYNSQKKYIIKQKNNKYFKNIINNVVSYEEEPELTKSGLTMKGKLSSVDGFSFDTDETTLFDRILSIEKIKIRSDSSSSLEPTFFSRYVNVDGNIKGFVSNDSVVDVNNLNPKYILSNRDAPSPYVYINKGNFKTEIQKLLPEIDGEIYNESDITFGETSFKGNVLGKPRVVSSTSYYEDDNVGEIQYLKNLLVSTGYINLKESNVFNLNGIKPLRMLDKLSIGDKLVECVPLSSPSSIKLEQHVGSGVLEIGYKNNILVAATSKVIYFKKCSDISAINDMSLTTGKVTPIYFDNGEIFTSMMWDSEKGYWIVTCESESNGSYAGTWTLKPSIAIDGESIYVDGPNALFTNGQGEDINTYQLVNVLTTDDDFIIDTASSTSKSDELKIKNDSNEEVSVLARDVSFVSVNNGAVSQVQNIIGTLSFTSQEIPLYRYINTACDGVQEFKFKIDASSKSSSIKVLNAAGFWIFDKSLSRWQYASSDSFSYIIKNFKGVVKVNLTVCDKAKMSAYTLTQNGFPFTQEYSLNGITASEGVKGEFIWSLPRPLNEEEIYVVLEVKNFDNKSTDGIRLKATEAQSSTVLKNTITTSFKVVNNNGKLYSESGSNITPLYKSGFYTVHSDKKMYVSSNKYGYMAAFNGDTIFIKSPTMRWTSSGYSSATSDLLWKRAKLPSMRDLSYSLFNLNEPDEAYTLVKDQREIVLDWLVDNYKRLSSQELALYNWLKDNEVVSDEVFLDKFEEEEYSSKYKDGIILSGVEIVLTTDGRVANFESGKITQYNVPQAVESQGGITTAVFLRRQTYMSYLNDFYTMILCCNRLADMFNVNSKQYGIKLFKLTDTAIVIVTKTDDVLTFPLSLAYSRDSLENFNNWKISSISSMHEVPNFETNDRKTIYLGCNGEYVKTESSMSTSINKLYHIESWILDGNIQIYGGYLQYDQNAINYISKVFGTDASGINTLKKPFIAYSTNNGETFTFKDVSSKENYSFSTEAASVTSIYYESGSYVYRVSNGTISQTCCLSLDGTSSDELLDDSKWSNTETSEKSNWVNSGIIESKGYLLTKNNAYIEAAFLHPFVGEVTSISDASFTVLFENTIENASKDDRIEVLFAINTKQSIENQADYIAYESKLFDSSDNLKVSDYVVVDSYSTANRAYSRNECLPLSNQDKSSFPCLASDTSHSIYNYTESAANDGSTVYNPVELINDEGERIVLFDRGTNSYVFSRNETNNILNSMSMREYYEESPRLTSCVSAIEVNEDYEFIVENGKISEILMGENRNAQIYIESLSINNGIIEINPTISYSESSTASKFFDELRDVFYEWPFATPSPDEVTFKKALYTPTTDFLEKLNYLNKNETFTVANFLGKYERIEIRNSKNNSSMYGVREKSTKIVLMNEPKIKMEISMPYNFKGGFSEFKNRQFNVNENIIAQLNEKKLNSVYMNPLGYGGILGNESFDTDKPWELDKSLFGNTLLFNDSGENIFLCDDSGADLFVKNGLFYLDRQESSKISFNNLAKEKNSLIIKNGDYNSQYYDTYNLYKIENDDFEVYTPINTISFENTSSPMKKLLSICRIYEGGVEADYNNYSVELKSKVYLDSAETTSDDIGATFEDGKIYYNTSSNRRYVENNTLEFYIYNKVNGVSKTIQFVVSKTKIPTIVNITPYKYINEYSSQAVSIEFDVEDITETSSISESIIKRSNKEYVLSGVNDESSILNVEYNSSIIQYRFDVQTLEPALYVNKDWTVDSVGLSDIYWKVYSKDIDISDMFTVKSSSNGKLVIADIATGGTCSFTKEFTSKTKAVEDVTFADNSLYIFTKYTKTQNTITNNSTSLKYLIDGIFGQIMMLTPKYASFKEAIANEGRLIKSNEFIDCSNNSFSKIEDTQITLSSLLSEKAEIKSTDFFNIKVLPINSILLSNSVLNNPDYYCEVSISDIENFSYDRVWIDESINLKPVIEYNGVYYNSENISEYSIDKWKNRDNLKVYLCDESGKFYKGVLNDGENLNYKVIGDNLGNCSDEIYQSVDPRICPCEALYKSSYEKYLNTYYDETNKYPNPFYKYINIKDYIKDSVVKNIIIAGSPMNKNGTVEIVETDETYNISNALSFDGIETNEITDTVYSDMIDYENGNLRLFIYGSDYQESIKLKKNLVLCGIEYKNPFYIETSNFWTNYSEDIEFNSSSNFVVDSTEDVSNKEKSCIENITEVGIFDKNDNLLAYLHHPIAQYDTKKNYIAYNLIIENTN